MNRKLLFLLVIFCGFFQFTFAQKYAVVTVKNGKKFYNHTVVEGNSLFGLQQMYNCPAEDILNANPGIERGLNDGQLILIPAIEKTILHTVQKQETLYAISKMYAVPVDSIIAKNPGAETGLKVGQRLKVENAIPRIQVDLLSVSVEENQRDIPAPSDEVKAKYEVSFKDSIITHTVLPSETMYSISKRFMVPLEDLRSANNLNSNKIQPGQVIKIPLKKEKVAQVAIRPVPPKDKVSKDSLLSFPKKDSYNIALFLPFNLDSTATFNKAVSNAALEYYMGANLAVDSLRKLGLQANFYVYDYQAKSETVSQQLAKPEFKNMDLIFAPLQNPEAETVALWAKNNKVRCVLSVNLPSKILEGNRFVYSMNTDNELLIKNLAKHIYQTHENQQIVLVKGSKPEEDWMYQLFLSNFRELPLKSSRPKIIEADWNNYKTFENLSPQTMVVFLSTDKDKVTKLLDRYKTLPNISVFGLKEWADWKEVNGIIANKYQFSYASPTFFDLKSETMSSFHKLYRRNYSADLTKMACLGYDVVLNVCSGFFLDIPMNKGLISTYKLNQFGKGNGIQNEAGYILKFQDFESKAE
ncbi:MAG: LysM peptidoglycan-binding domain-containing protein [Flavobacteriales bacterium]|nr:LysM peptidoglycan-binding domain-containing protein [Crocinitomicaceae bacterium]NBX80388.1 LysM peptidoglycan-binding domain-containing protein [Flavobacteriales bacterium]NCA19858.1 LysM peptidoglycan-binding domain-containing protein [Crocinitomicaceae bacterium]